MKYENDPANAFPIGKSDDYTVNASERETGEAFAKAFSNFCNDMRRTPKGIALDKLMREHRSLQQGMMRFCMAFIARMADQSHDLRNEASVQLANEIMERTEYASRALPNI